MNFDNFKKILQSGILFAPDRLVAPTLLPIAFYFSVAAIFVLALNHIFASFALGFGAGLWGLVETAIIGGLAVLVSRILFEALAGFIHHNQPPTTAHRPHAPTMLENVRDAIDQLADQTDEMDSAEPKEIAEQSATKAPSTTAKPRRTAKRSPAKSTTTGTKATGAKSTARKSAAKDKS